MNKKSNKNADKNGIRKLKNEPNEKDFKNFSQRTGRALLKSIDQITFKPRREKQKQAIESIKEKPINFLIGTTGTGKTLIAVTYALMAVQAGKFDNILFLRASVASEDIGYLPGEASEKLSPFMQSMTQPVSKLLGYDVLEKLIESRVIRSDEAVGFLRGTNFERTIVIVDEMQNLTKKQLYLILTRLTDEGKIILTGDEDQCDLEDFSKSAINDLELFENCDDIGLIKFNPNEAVRSKVLNTVLKCYKKS